MKTILILLFVFTVHTSFGQYVLASKVKWWESDQPDKIELNYWTGKSTLQIKSGQYYIYDGPDTNCTLIDQGRLFFPDSLFLSLNELSSYPENAEFIIISRTLNSINEPILYDSTINFIRILCFRETMPIVLRLYDDSTAGTLAYKITNGFSWTHGKIILQKEIPIDYREMEKINSKIVDIGYWQLKSLISCTSKDLVVEIKIKNKLLPPNPVGLLIV